MRWLASFAAVNVALVAVVLLMLWVTGSFAGAGLSTSGWVALFLGIIFTSALGIALMGLVFYSDREDVDDRAYHATDRKK
jgi:ABC-type multidrug transport system permease subunit